MGQDVSYSAGLPSALEGEGAPKGRMRGILTAHVICSSAEERIPLTLNNLLNADYSVPLPQGAGGGRSR